MTYLDRIAIDPAVRSGKPCIRGTRVTVYDILEYLAAGMAEDQISSDFRSSDVKIYAALEFAAARERKLATSPAV